MHNNITGNITLKLIKCSLYYLYVNKVYWLTDWYLFQYFLCKIDLYGITVLESDKKFIQKVMIEAAQMTFVVILMIEAVEKLKMQRTVAVEYNLVASQGWESQLVSTTSGQTTRDATEDLSAQVWQFCLAVNISTVRHPDNIRLEGRFLRNQGWKIVVPSAVSKDLMFLLFHILYGGELT